MKAFLILSIFWVSIIPFNLKGQSFWSEVGQDELLSRDFPGRDLPEMPVEVYSLDFEEIKVHLGNAPREFAGRKGLSVVMPVLAGQNKTFQVFDSPVMEDRLASKYSEIRSFVGRAVDGARIHMGYGAKGFYAMIMDGGNTILIDNYSFENQRYYAVYKMSDYPTDFLSTFRCENEEHEHDALNDHLAELGFDNFSRNGDNVALRTFRLALATTTQYSSIFGLTKASVMEELNKLVNRVNMVLYNDLAARLVMIAETEDLIQLSGNAYTNGNAQAMIDENPLILQTLGVVPDMYDIGHVLGTNGGGLAQLRSLCTTSGGGPQMNGADKARGVSTWATVQGDPFHIQVVAHEVGHQFGSQHTFNNCNNGGNENNSTGYEPGSGHTIMSYFGLCGPDNAAGTQLDNYHWYSLGVMYNHITETYPDCGTVINNVNTRPTAIIDTEGGFTIPIGTPFKLSGRAEDNESSEDELTYSWEQANTGTLSPLGQPMGTAPLFRVYAPSNNPMRYFPAFSDVLNGVSRREEVLPRTTRPLNFRFVVRDNDPRGGAFGQSEIAFFSNSNAGPFVVLTPTLGNTYEVGEYIRLEWDVAGTDRAPVNCKKVNIFIVGNNGQNILTLAENVENNGAVDIEIPNFVSNGLRFLIEAADNIFYNVSGGNFSIVTATEPTISAVPGGYFEEVCTPELIEIKFEIRPVGGFEGTAEVSYLGGLPDDAVVLFNKTTVNAEDELTATVEFNGATAEGVLEMEIGFLTSNGINLTRKIQMEVLSLNPSGIFAVTPQDGAEGIQGTPTLRWTSVDHADEYTVSLKSLDGNISFSTTIQDTFFILPEILPPGTVYYWTVGVVNRCGIASAGNQKVFSFATVNSSCETFDSNVSSGSPFILPSNNPGSRDLVLNVPVGGVISDINIPVFNGTTSSVNALSVDLISPAGTTVTLFRNACGTSANWNVPMDDHAVADWGCPITSGETKKTQFRNLNNFNGQDAQGDWIFRFNNNSFNNAQVRGVSIEVCGTILIPQPTLAVNEILEVPTLQHQVITSNWLKAEETSSSNDDLIFTVVELPKKGKLERYGAVLSQGGRFTQSALNDFGIIYYHTGSEDDTADNFVFILTTTEGGYVGTFVFEIVIDDSFVTGSTEISSSFDFKVYPNPARGLLNIEVSKELEHYELDLLDMNGRLLRKISGRTGESRNEIILNGLSAGTYLIRLKSANETAHKKVIIL